VETKKKKKWKETAQDTTTLDGIWFTIVGSYHTASLPTGRISFSKQRAETAARSR
jgi:hypothetical protein